jgi:hypothetical protein
LRRHYIVPPFFQNENLDTQIRTFKVKFANERAHDDGGPYRAIFSEWCQEMLSHYLPVFVPSPNKSRGEMVNNEYWIFNPACNRYDMYRKAGKIFGIALRNRIQLDMALPSAVWKNLVGLKPHRKDLQRFDAPTVRFMSQLESLFANVPHGSAADAKSAGEMASLNVVMSKLLQDVGGMCPVV